MLNQEAVLETEETRQPLIPTTEAVARRPPEERRTVAWIGKSVVIKGELLSSEDLTIDGRVEGTITLPNFDLTIGPDADIRAEVVAKTVTAFGVITGTIRARAKVDIRKIGSVIGNITTPRLIVADGATLQGRVETDKSSGSGP